MKAVWWLVPLLLSASAIGGQQYIPLPAELPSRYGVLGLRARTAGTDSLIVDQVLLHSPAHRAGIRRGDHILAVGPYRILTTTELSRCIQSHAPGDSLTLTLEQDGQTVQLTCAVTDVKELYYLLDEEGTTAAEHAAYHRDPAPDEEIARSLVDRLAPAALDSLRAALVFDADRYGRDGRLAAVDLALRDPLATGRIAGVLLDAFAAGTGPGDHLATAALHLDLGAIPAPDRRGRAHFPTDALAAASAQTERAYASLAPTERDSLPSGIRTLLRRLGGASRLDAGDSSETAGHIRTLRLAKKVDLRALFAGALHLTQWAAPDTLRAIRQAYTRLSPIASDSLPPGVRGTILYADSTAQGWLLVGASGPNFYGINAAAIIDLGGDDTYLHRPLTPVPLIVDYQGDDRHIGSGAASGIGGVGLLIDLAGDDLYYSNGLALGSAFCGIGLLWDHRGNDTYISRRGGQGVAFFGAGLLVDDAGDDTYSADLLAQGFGGTSGLGLLRDLSGDDRYFVDGQVPSSYGTPDTYAGWGQGVGCGLRGYGSGGIGLLVDGGGSDTYQGGEFAQGVGYFFGLGVLGDLRGDDRYRGTRYAQGAAAHQAAGALIDRAGDDRYYAKMAASQGAGWDAAIGYLADWAGNDRYDAQHLSQGAAAMNGLGLLFDGDGADDYQTLTGQAQGSSTTYWGGRNAPNLGLLIDRGGDRDAYSLRENEADTRDAGIGLFSDR